MDLKPIAARIEGSTPSAPTIAGLAEERHRSMYTTYVNREGDYAFSAHFTMQDKVPAGVYSVYADMMDELHLKTEYLQTEQLLALPDSPIDNIIKKINHFLQPKVRDAFKNYGMLYKRGILLYGPPGTGKTSVSNQVIKIGVEQKDMIVLLNPQPQYVKRVITDVRGVEKTDRSFMVIWEEFEDWLQREESDILSLMDGVDQVDNVIYLVTTNHIEHIEPRIKNRPSRFADVLEIGLPDEHVRRTFLAAKAEKMNAVIALEDWVQRTKGLSIDHLKDLLISVHILGIEFDDALARMRVLECLPNEKH